MFDKLRKIVNIFLDRFYANWLFSAALMSAIYAVAILFLVFCVIKFIKWCWLF